MMMVMIMIMMWRKLIGFASLRFHFRVDNARDRQRGWLFVIEQTIVMRGLVGGSWIS